MPVCAKIISSWVRKSLSVAKVHVFEYSLIPVALGALLAAVSLASMLQVGDWARCSTPARYYSSTYITTTDQHQESVQHTVLSNSG